MWAQKLDDGWGGGRPRLCLAACMVSERQGCVTVTALRVANGEITCFNAFVDRKMPSTRRPRGQQESQTLYAEDTDVDEEETPKAQRLKKRLSEGHAPDASFTSESGRPPLRTKSVNINDDAAEKRKRRKSAKLTVIDSALPGPSSESTMTSDPDHGESVRAGKQKQLNTVAPPQVSDTPFDVMNSNYEEWMKMATDNVRDHLLCLISTPYTNTEN